MAKRPDLDPLLRPSGYGSVDGLSERDVPSHCDMGIMPKGDKSRQYKNKVYVVWAGFETGLFWCW